MEHREFECADCGHVWQVEPCTMGGKHGYELSCPKCGSVKKMKIENGVKHVCGGQRGGCCGGH